jgi:aldehyde dehydrogenase (NAD+)
MQVDARDRAEVVPDGSLLIDGEWRADASEGSGEHMNPATGRPLGRYAVAGAAEVDDAVAAAKSAFPAWRATSAQERRGILLRIALLLEERVLQHATLRSREGGTPFKKPRPGSRWLASEYFHYYAGWVDKLHGTTVPAYSAPSLDYSVPEPYGVVAVLVPWNAPVVSTAMKVAPALAAGNCVVLKPSDLGPFTPQIFGQICVDAGVPPGVINVVTGGVAAGEALVSHAGVDKISFTGGGATARQVMQAAAVHLKPVLLELGGKSADLVFEDADLDAAAAMVCQMTLINGSGQGCNLPTRILAHESVYDDFVGRVAGRAAAIRQGDPFDPETQMGPVISEGACLRILGMIENASREGARLVAGGARAPGPLAEGYFVQPTVFADVDPGSTLAREEVFGPVLAVMRFGDEDEAVATANASEYGLAGYVWTNDLRRAHRVAAALEAGWIGVNGFPPMPPNAAFGGYKSSGFGREGGLEGLLEYVRTKNVYIAMG